MLLTDALQAETFEDVYRPLDLIQLARPRLSIEWLLDRTLGELETILSVAKDHTKRTRGGRR